MRFRFGLMIGFGTGYYFGSKAGHDRHRQLQGWMHKLGGSEAIETATGKAKAVVDLGVERARDIAEQRRGQDIDLRSTAGTDLTDLDEGMNVPFVEVTPAANGIGG